MMTVIHTYSVGTCNGCMAVRHGAAQRAMIAAVQMSLCIIRATLQQGLLDADIGWELFGVAEAHTCPLDLYLAPNNGQRATAAGRRRGRRSMLRVQCHQ